eukprot:scaffold1222_cov317-Pavlova_lutheri.AAC.18
MVLAPTLGRVGRTNGHVVDSSRRASTCRSCRRHGREPRRKEAGSDGVRRVPDLWDGAVHARDESAPGRRTLDRRAAAGAGGSLVAVEALRVEQRAVPRDRRAPVYVYGVLLRVVRKEGSEETNDAREEVDEVRTCGERGTGIARKDIEGHRTDV